MKKYYVQENLYTELKYTPDVLVCGGGFAGVSAALSAAREGKQVLLLDRGFMLGGLATAGLVTIYLPLCDGLGNQVSFGIAEELLRLSVADFCDGERGAKNWLFDRENTVRNEHTPRFEVNFNPQLFAIAAEKLLLKEGVQILYGTYAVGANTQENKIKHVFAENKSGRFAIAPKAVVDCTGDADLAVFSGAPTENFKQGNVLAAWYYTGGKDGYRLHTLGFCDIPDDQKTAENAPQMLVSKRFSGLCGEEISEQMILSHASTYNDYMKQRQTDETLEIATIATIPQLRMTRRIDGEYTLSDKEIRTYFKDSIGLVSDWRKRGPVYEVPFRTLYSAQVKNLIFAGRHTSVTDSMWDIMRVIPCCAVTGEAAGLAAAMTDDFSALDVNALQEKLLSRGVKLHI